MPGHDEILELPRSRFESVVQALDKAFERTAAAFIYNTRSSAYAIEIFDKTAAQIEDQAWDDLESVQDYFEQLLIFAFESAPAAVIVKWANGHIEGSGEEAVSRVEFLRLNAPSVKLEWDSRMYSAGSTLGDIDSDIVLSSAAPVRALALIRMDSFVPGSGPRRSPIGSTRQWMSFTASANEIGRLINYLGTLQANLSSLNDEDPDENQEITNGQ